MITERLDPAAIPRAAALLRAGGLVAFPTETVYGLGANALDSAAVAKIFAAKQRPGWDPLIVHIASRAMLDQVATIPAEANTRIEQLMAHLWPGPLTLLLPRTAAIPDAVTAGRPLVGVRMPAHPLASALIEAAGMPIAAPSANRFGRTSPTTAEHVLSALDGRIDAVLDGGPCTVGVESSVLDPTVWPMILYRPGAVTPAMLEALCGPGLVRIYQSNSEIQAPEALPSPGVGLRHYAPRARLQLIPVPHLRFTGFQDVLIQPIAEARGEQIGVLLPDDWLLAPQPESYQPTGVRSTTDRPVWLEPTTFAPFVYPWGPWNRPEILAQRLFAGLHALDAAGVTVILCPVPNGPGIAEALRDRLEKAAKPR